MIYKVLIPTAGTGSRLADLTKNVNKSLVAIANKPSISYIIEKFPQEVPMVIALGYKGNLVREYLELAYPERKFEFVEVSPFEGEGSGLGLTVLSCKEYLQCPFIFCSCDTIVDERIAEPDHNWMGYAQVEGSIDQYRTVQVEANIVLKILEKGTKANNIYPYIGLAGIYDYKSFWQAMEAGGAEAILLGESYGLRELKNITASKFSWHDTGNLEALNKVRSQFHDPEGPNILEKPTEAIWFVNDKVIKFNTDDKFISDRVKRTQVLGDFVPPITGATEHMYCYQEVQGEVLSKIIDLKIFKELLDYSQKFWDSSPAKPKTLSPEEQKRFKDTCVDFYKIKTFQRVEQYYKVFGNTDKEEMINGLERPSTKALLDSLDWDWVTNGLPGNFHGDFHFENILYNKNTHEFTFLDWRQNFGGVIEYGDVYYDLGKLNHGLIVCHELIAKDLYETKINANEISYDLHRKQILVECERFFQSYLESKGYDYRKVQVMTALIYLNIAALHHYPYCHLLYYLGKDMLAKSLSRQINY